MQKEAGGGREEVIDGTGKSKFVEFPEGRHSAFVRNHPRPNEKLTAVRRYFYPSWLLVGRRRVRRGSMMKVDGYYGAVCPFLFMLPDSFYVACNMIASSLYPRKGFIDAREPASATTASPRPYAEVNQK